MSRNYTLFLIILSRGDGEVRNLTKLISIVNRRGIVKILVTAKFIGDGGGSGRYMQTLIDGLVEEGHEVTGTTQPQNGDYDLIICSHRDQFQAIKDNPAQKVFVSHGLINDEAFQLGADRYVSVSEEVRQFRLKSIGIDSEVVPQPIKILERKWPSSNLEKILIIRRYKIEDDPFEWLFEKYDVRISDPSTPIEDQIDWADLCITLGRGALESFAQGKPVIVADARDYIGVVGDGYVTWRNIEEIATCNFSGRRYRHPITRQWLEGELAKYNAADSVMLHKYVSRNHDVKKVIPLLLDGKKQVKVENKRDMTHSKVGWGVMVNDKMRLDMVLKQSQIKGNVHVVYNPDSATKGLNKLLETLEGEGNDVAILTHQDMYYRAGWLDIVKEQLSQLPDSWVVAGIIGKDMEGLICGMFHDMRFPLLFRTDHIHEFPHPACCFDECCIIVNLSKGFRFDEAMEGFDLYGTLCVLQAWEMGGTAWIIDAFAEHYCMRPFDWCPDKLFLDNYKWLHDRFKGIQRLDSTVIGMSEDDLKFAVSAS